MRWPFESVRSSSASASDSESEEVEVVGDRDRVGVMESGGRYLLYL
jgi:hypothetical protein